MSLLLALLLALDLPSLVPFRNELESLQAKSADSRKQADEEMKVLAAQIGAIKEAAAAATGNKPTTPAGAGKKKGFGSQAPKS